MQPHNVVPGKVFRTSVFFTAMINTLQYDNIGASIRRNSWFCLQKKFIQNSWKTKKVYPFSWGIKLLLWDKCRPCPDRCVTAHVHAIVHEKISPFCVRCKSPSRSQFYYIYYFIIFIFFLQNQLF